MPFSPHVVRTLAVLTVIAASVPAVSTASPDVASIIRVSVVTPAPVAASVELRSSTSSLRWVETFQAPDDVAVLMHVPPGPYELTLRLADNRETRIRVDVPAATLLEFAADLGAGAVSGALAVRLRRSEPLAGDVRVFDQTVLATFPSDDAVASIVETAVAPLIVDRISSGGLWLAEPARLGGYGSSWRQTSIALGSLDVTDPVRIGTPMMRLPPDAVESLVVATALLPASMGGPGPALQVTPKAAAAERAFAAEFAAIPNALRGTHSEPGLPSLARFAMHRDVNAQLGSPLGSRTGLFVAVRHTATDRLERDDPRRLRTQVRSAAASATVAGGANTRLRLAATVDGLTLPSLGRARVGGDVPEADTMATAQAAWDRWTAGGTAWSAAFGLAQGTFSPSVDSARVSSSLAGTATVDRLVDGPVPVLFESVPAVRRRWTAAGHVAPGLGHLARRHLLTTGTTVAYSTADHSSTPVPPVAELVGGYPARIWEYAYGGPETHWTATELAAYVTDRITVHDRLRLDAGVRLETTRGSARGGSAIAWNALSPRLAVRWRLDPRGRLALYGGYAQYRHRLPLDALAFGDPAALRGRVYRWHDANDDRILQEGERGALVAFVGPCCTALGLARIDPGLKQPRTDETAGGVDLRLGGWSVRIQGTYREEHHLIASVNAGLTPDDYARRSIVDLGEPFRDPPEERLLPVYDRVPSSFGRDAYVVTNPPAHSAEYLGYDLVVEGTIAGRLRMHIEGSLYHGWAMGANRGFRPTENDHGLVGELFENPNARTGARGNTFLDRTYVVKWWAAYQAPRDYVLSAVARYQDGQPFGRLAIVPDLRQGAEAIYGFRPGRSRFTFTGTLDARLEKTQRLGRTRIVAALEVFNLLNAAEEVEEDVATGPSFRRPTALQPPRAARAALRLLF